jgi:hypothetical protein
MSTTIHYYPCSHETPKNHDLVIHEFLSGMNLLLTLITIILSYGMFLLFIGVDYTHDRILRLQQRGKHNVIDGDRNDSGEGEYEDDIEDEMEDDEDGNQVAEDVLSVSDTTDGEDDNDNDNGTSVSEQADMTYFS